MQRKLLIFQGLLYAIHLETSWWIETNVSEYLRYRRLILPQWDRDSMTSPLAWKLYYIELKQRVLPPLLKCQATLFFAHGFQSLLARTCTKETMLRLNQHPPRRALAISERESDRLQVGVEVFVASIWANLLFFAANCAVGQIDAFYDFYRKQARSRSRQVQNNNEKQDIVILLRTTWNTIYMNSRRLFYSAVGAGLGSVFMPGWGTLLGMGVGDEWARRQPHLELPRQTVLVLRNAVGDLVTLLASIRLPRWPYQEYQGGMADDSEVGEETPFHDDLICGCCQTTMFSSNPNSRDCAPVSSRACSHTICKSCVQKTHLAYMERTSTFDEWVKCPLCNATRAFSSHDHLVNRSLCAAISAIEASQSRALEKASVKMALFNTDGGPLKSTH